jgi:hypothetical protein
MPYAPKWEQQERERERIADINIKILMSSVVTFVLWSNLIGERLAVRDCANHGVLYLAV